MHGSVKGIAQKFGIILASLTLKEGITKSQGGKTKCGSGGLYYVVIET